ncbi:MAG: helix-turn-helix transcriptional regulator, partial [Balneolaceae bacterium]|nr:helix-turn-helix transcriptional regulator [Balneolaceae bacterium]
MKESTYIPKGQLSNYVKFIWCNENYVPEISTERVLPSGSSQLIINLHDNEFRHYYGPDRRKKTYEPIIITGIHSGHIFLDSQTRISTIGVVQKPGAVSALFQIPADKFKDKVISLDSVLSMDVSELRDRLIDADHHFKKFKIMELFLNRLLDLQHQLHPAVDYGLHQIDLHHGTQSVANIIDKIGYSRRWFSEVFRNSVGISPKQYSRIQRFQHNLMRIRKLEEPNWPKLALSFGY